MMGFLSIGSQLLTGYSMEYQKFKIFN